MRVLIADDQALVRDALRSLLEERGHEVVGEASTGHEAIEAAQLHQPHVVLLDLDMSPDEMRVVTEHISAELPDSHVLVLTTREDEEAFFAAVASGAKGYVTKNLPAREFCPLVERVGRGETVISPSRESAALAELERRGQDGRHPRAATDLTPRERQLLEHLATGSTSNRALAITMGVTENTIRFHMRNILEKLNVHSRAAAVAHAITHGVVTAVPD